MPKRKASSLSSTTTKTTDNCGSSSSNKNLKLYQKAYKGGGVQDVHFAIFRDVHRFVQPQNVLYPGCHRHLTASLAFPNVTYVDYDKKVAALYAEPAARRYVEAHKIYPEESKYRFACHNILEHSQKNDNIPSELATCDFDLLISLSAGTLAERCAHFVGSSNNHAGWLLVNDSHADARMAYVQDQVWELMAYWDDALGQFVTDGLDRCFQVVVPSSKASNEPATTKPLSVEQAEESVKIGSVSKRSFKLLCSPMFYLFKKKTKNK